MMMTTTNFVASALALAMITMTTSSVVNAANVTMTWTVKPTITDETFSPDCYQNRLMMLINDAFPGPPLVANVGDLVQVTLINESKDQTTTIHYHGLHMTDNQYGDGPVSITQCGVAPMQTEYVEFVAKEVGTHYWHAHKSMQKVDGLMGPIWIKDPNDPQEQELAAKYDEEVSVFLMDWYHNTGEFQRTQLDSEPFKWVGNPDTLLINGKGGGVDCLMGNTTPPSAQMEIIPVETGKTYRLRIINAAGLVAVNFGVAGHNLTLVEADGTLIEPIEVETLDVSPGQRYSALLTANQEPGWYGMQTVMRARDPKTTFPGLAYVKYADAPEEPPVNVTLPNHPAWDYFEAPYGLEFDASLKTMTVPQNATDTILGNATPDLNYVVVGTQNRRFEDNRLRWAVNNVSLHFPSTPMIAHIYDIVATSELGFTLDMDFGPEYVDLPMQPPTTWNYSEDSKDLTPGPGVYLGTSAIPTVKLEQGQMIQVVMQNARALNGVAELHPWHVHGNYLWLVGQGYGNYDPAVHDSTFNLVNPVRRDTLTLWPNSWAAFRMKADNPGVWAYHCHIASHWVMGMGMVFVVSPDMLEAPPPGTMSCVNTGLDPSMVTASDSSGGDTMLSTPDVGGGDTMTVANSTSSGTEGSSGRDATTSTTNSTKKSAAAGWGVFRWALTSLLAATVFMV